MAFYPKKALELVCAQVNRDNPTLPTPFTADNVMLLSGPFTTNLGTSGRNTRAVFNGIAGKGNMGKREVFYDRVNLTTLFSGLPSAYTITAPNSAAVVGDLLPAINDALGLALEPADVSNATQALGMGRTPTQVTLTLSASCLSFTGSLTLSWQRAAAGYYPNSGPGTKYMLVGTMTEGYFGMVSQDEMFNSSELINELFTGVLPNGVTPLVSATMYWLKFALDNEIVYFPSINVASGLSWNQLNAIGAVFADRKEPMVFDRNGTYFFVPRLAKMSKTQSISPVRLDPTGDAARLFAKVHTSAYGSGEWDNLAVGGVGLDVSTNFVWMNTRSDVADPKPVYLTSMNQQSVNTTPVGSANQYRPMIVLKDAAVSLVRVRNVQGERYATLRAPGLSYVQEADPLQLVRMMDVVGTLYNTVRRPWLNPAESALLLAVQNLAATRPIKPIWPTVSVTITPKTNLSSTDGELTGF